MIQNIHEQSYLTLLLFLLCFMMCNTGAMDRDAEFNEYASAYYTLDSILYAAECRRDSQAVAFDSILTEVRAMKIPYRAQRIVVDTIRVSEIPFGQTNF